MIPGKRFSRESPSEIIKFPIRVKSYVKLIFSVDLTLHMSLTRLLHQKKSSISLGLGNYFNHSWLIPP